MKETDKKRGSNNKQGKRPSKAENCRKNLKVKEIDVKASSGKQKSNILVSDSNMGSESSEVYNSMVIDYVDDVYRSEEALDDSKTLKMIEKESEEKLNEHSSDLESEPREGTAEESDPGTIGDSVSFRGDPQMADEEKLENASRVPKKVVKNESSDSFHAPKVKSDQKTNSLQIKASKATPRKATKPNKGPSKSTIKNTTDNSRNMKVHPKPLSEISERVDDKTLEEVKEADILDEVSNGAYSVCSDDEIVSNEGNGENEDRAALDQKVEEMENRIEKLEEELKEVAALEIALYSVVPEHGNSAHKVHTPARRLSRLYIHACKYWSQVKRATIAKNTVSGLVLVAKSCGNDVSRLTFWLSNTVALREIVSQAFGSSCLYSSLTKIVESNGGKKSEPKSSLFNWKNNSGSRQPSKQGFLQFVDDWQETRTFTAALEKVESWIFSRIVESIWWQTLAPNMQSPTDDSTTSKAVGRLLGPALGDQQQGNFSVNLWKNAFHDAFRRLCPVRSGGHDCGCLPVLARKVMEQCVGRLDVAMFNAILRESAHEIPTDPISDPIVDSKVLPIPAGDLSFGSGAQLKNSVGNWVRWLTNSLGMDADSSMQDGKNSSEDGDRMGSDEPKCFPLLNALSDLLMLPKDMLMDRTIRMEVCPSISLSLVKRILCNFTPDEFCPDPVPGAVLEALNAECIIERRLSGESGSSFPYIAVPVAYTPPSSSDVADKIGEGGGKSQLSPSASFIQRKGYTSDEELDELESCLTSVIDKMPSSPTTLSNGNGNGNHHDQSDHIGANARYKLLREVWMAT
ncbi:nucleolar protein gar2-related [Abeliophyllum distichum]|uniref:Nucleolar protein gar2-related n=1 Tax=Abeliophyllum distichum TaxID=126358 RepID=A0ABD1VCL8_9LAMI